MTVIHRSWRKSWVLAAALAVLVSAGGAAHAGTKDKQQAYAAWQAERDMGSAAFYDHIGKTLRKGMMPEAGARCQRGVKTVAVDNQTRARWWARGSVKRACGTPGR